jgi:iron(III) transport system substrate-binding protein
MLRLLFAGTLLVIGLGCQTEGSQTPAEGEIPKVGAEPSASTPVSKETPPSSPGIKEAPVKQPAQKGETSLVVYSGRGAVLVESLFAAFTEQTGIRVDVRYGKTGALAQQLAKEGLNSPADLFFAQDSGYLGALDQAGLFDDILKPDQEKVAPRYLPKQSNWLPTSGRARVLVYSPERIKPEQLPKRLEDLPTTTLSGRFGWAPTNASLHAHVSALRSLWGEAKTESWLNGMKALKPVKFPKNSPQVRGVSAGEIDVGWVNHYYLHKLRAADPSLKATQETS